MRQRDKTIYIMGRGHSGSTILAGLLGQAVDVENVGELIYPMRGVCGCGEPFERCEFWQNVRVEFERQSNMEWEASLNLLQAQANALSFVRTWFASRGSTRVQQLTEINREIVRSVLRVAAKTCCLDASKQPARALLLMRHAPATKFVHVVRHPDDYLRSYLSRLKTGKVNFLRREVRTGPLNFLVLILVAMSWVVANMQCELVRLYAPSRVLRVRFEDLTQNPDEQLQRLETFVGFDLRSVIEAVRKGQRLNVGHIIGGNDHMRSSGGFRLEPRKGAPDALPFVYRATVRLISWPLMLTYRYPLA